MEDEINISDEEFIDRLKKAVKKEGTLKIKTKMTDEKYKRFISDIRKAIKDYEASKED